MAIACPNCRQPIENSPDLAGQSVVCPRCNTNFFMPGIPRAVSATPTFVASHDAGPRNSFREARSLTEMFDTSFEVYVTPIIVQITWGLYVICVAILTVGAIAAAFFLPFNSHGGLALQIAMRCLGIGVVMLSLFLLLMMVRLALELSVVFFNISLSLQSIDRKTKV